MQNNNIVVHMENLIAFLEPFKTKTGMPFSHVSKKTKDLESGSYFIPDEHLDNFYTYYSNVILLGFSVAIA